MNVGIVGAGGLGTLLGATLARSCDVRVLVRDRPSERAIAERGGLVLDDGLPQRVLVSSEPELMDGVDVLLVALKTFAVVGALAAIRKQLDSHVPIVSFSNGADAVASIEYALARHAATALAPTTEAVARKTAGVAVRTGRGKTTVGWAAHHAGDESVLDALVAALAFDLAIERAQPIEPFVWAKLIANAAINPLTALAGVVNGELFERPELRGRAVRLAREAAAVAHAKGIVLPFDDAAAHVRAIARATATNRSSMLVDLEAGMPTEIDAINGAIVREAAELGIPVPENVAVIDEVRARRKA